MRNLSDDPGNETIKRKYAVYERVLDHYRKGEHAMILDKKGKLFGKISIVDVLVILIVIAVGAGLYYKFGKSGTVTPFTKTSTIQMSVYLETANDYFVKNIKVGDVVKDRVQNVVMGKVVDIEIGPDISYFINDKGLVVKGSRENYSSVTITFQGEGIYSPTGVTFNGVEYYINKNGTEWRIGDTSCFAKISDIKLIKE